MHVSIPKKYLPAIEDFLNWMTAEKISEEKEGIIFEIPVSFRLTMENLGINTHKEWEKFCKNIKVEGGRKSVFRDRVSLTPYLSKCITFKVAEGELQLLRKHLKKRGPVGIHLSEEKS